MAEADGSVVRPAQAADFAGLMALYAQLHPSDPVLDDGSDRRVFDEIVQTPNLHLFVLQAADGALHASCYLNLIPNITRRASPYGIIENVITEQSLRNRGLGQRIIGHALRFAWDAGCYKVMLQTGSRQASTHNFYRACGFAADDKFAFVARPPD